MECAEPGHRYVLHNTDGPGVQEIRFVRRIPPDRAHEGILAQELIRVLIDRVLFLYAQVPCDEDTEILKNLRECLVLFESRAARRTIEKSTYPEREPVCRKCQHILCLCGEGTFSPYAS